MAQDDKFDVMADLCILAGQAVMQVGSGDLRAAMRVVLGILGREVAVRSVAERAADRPVPDAADDSAKGSTQGSADRSTKRGRNAVSRIARPARLAPCA